MHFIHLVMAFVIRDEIQLNDEPAIKVVISLFGIKTFAELSAKRRAKEPRPPKPQRADEPYRGPYAGTDLLSREVREKLAAYQEAAKRFAEQQHATNMERQGREPPFKHSEEPRPLWRSYFVHGAKYQQWHDGNDIWFAVDEDAGVLRTITISGLRDEREAKDVRWEYAYRRADGEGIEAVVERVVSDPERAQRAYRRLFQHHISYAHRYFEWRDGDVVEGPGRILPISQSGLNAEDIELLRQVFKRLPPREKKLNVGDEPKRSRPVKDLKTAREKVKQLSREVADVGFDAWVNSCLRVLEEKSQVKGVRKKSNLQKPTQARELYQHYKKWIVKHGDNRGERAESKRTAMSERTFGMLMRQRFGEPARHGAGYFYPMRVKARS